MKNIVLFCFFQLLALAGYSQVMVDSTDINQLDIQYIEIYHSGSVLMPVPINYGQNPTGLMSNFEVLRDENGESFRNSIAALNFLYRNGWELVLPSAPAGEDGPSTYLLRRRE